MNKRTRRPYRKPRPSMPHWYWLDVDGCWWCKNKNNCNSCKILKRVRAEQDGGSKRDKINKIRSKEREDF